MNTLTSRLNEFTEETCPYEDVIADVCRASITSMKLGVKAGFKFCAGEEYNGCPIFLAKILRTR
jgi:hypothetical protein